MAGITNRLPDSSILSGDINGNDGNIDSNFIADIQGSSRYHVVTLRATNDQTRLRNKRPKLSLAESRFMALCKLNYSNRERAHRLGVSILPIRQHRSRLRRKLNIPVEVEIEELAATI
ncbi:hypothetical protein GCM10023187_00610 [Nibrella viscosa]|uniref:HTH luxR-type domain-containing protein n=1 Tax=Nibrella viscosa TaxID=1084524 RepID=A0ABP8JRF7_9BACT